MLNKKFITSCAVWIARLLTGAVFIVSGAAKMIDPYGFIYKIGDYLAAWDFSLPSGFIILGAIALSMSEFLIGVSIATGTLRRTAVWCATALMAFMLPLTLYIALVNPVEDCGCFGDFLVISNWATFWKNVAITAALLFLIRKNRSVGGLFPAISQWLQLTIAGVWIAWVGVMGYFVQPLIDFRPYPTGTQLLHEPDLTQVKYIYQNQDGTTKEFPATDLPDESDNQWTYVGIKNDTPLHESTLAITDEQGDDVTYDVIGATDTQLLLLIPDIADAGISDTYTANELAQHITRQENSTEAFAAIVHASTPNDLNQWIDLSMADYPIYTSEDTTIKTIARGKMAVVCLQSDTIVWKRTLASVNPDLLAKPDFNITSLAPPAEKEFKQSLLLMIGAELILLLIAHSLGQIKRLVSGKWAAR